MTQDKSLSDLQLAIMRVLWQKDEATVAEVHGALQSDRGLALTTIATVLSRLEKRGMVLHRTDGRQFVYRTLVSEETVRSSMVDELAELLFQGDVAELMNHLLAERDFTSDDLSRVKNLIEAHEREEGKAPNDSD
jgi:predicted transcriptional regulator